MTTPKDSIWVTIASGFPSREQVWTLVRLQNAVSAKGGGGLGSLSRPRILVSGQVDGVTWAEWGSVYRRTRARGKRERERACSCQRRLEPRVCAKGAQSDAELPHGTLFEPAQEWECGEPAQPDAEQRCHQAWGKDGEIMRGSDHSCRTMRRHGYHGRESRCWARSFVRYSDENGILLKEVAAICCFCGANCSPKPWVLVSRN